MNMKEDLKIAIDAAYFAGQEILSIYDADFDVFIKKDQSPLTEADLAAHRKIVKKLSKSPYPVLSEEGEHANYEDRKDWEQLWVVDPLDGTKEFVKRNGEFTVNIALVKNNKPILGVIYVPVKGVMYYSHEDLGAFKVEKVGQDLYSDLEDLHSNAKKLPVTQEERPFTVVASRSHLSNETEDYIEELRKTHPNLTLISAGSSLKFCLVAEGSADTYPRYAPTMEWDTAAGHAIVNAVGKQVIDLSTNEEMVYNREELRNNFFLIK